MLIDLHIHTYASGDAVAAPEDLIERALAVGVDGFCVVEHDSYEASETAELLGDGSGVVVLRGIEISTDLGHMLVYGLENDDWQTLARGKVVAAQTLVDYVVEMGGVAVPAHPFRAGTHSMGDAIATLVGVFAIEGFNGQAMRSENVEACEFATRYDLRLVGGSDAHMPGHLGRVVTQFDRRIESIADLVAELKAGRFQGRYLLGPIEF